MQTQKTDSSELKSECVLIKSNVAISILFPTYSKILGSFQSFSLKRKLRVFYSHGHFEIQGCDG